MKKLLATLLAGSMMLGLAACSNSTPVDTAPSGTGSGGELAYPDGELRIQVPFQTGGALDVQVRTTAQYLSKELGVNVIIENTPGAGGQLGTTEYLDESANTSTILLTDAWLMTVTPLISQVEYTLEDYIPIIDHNVTNFCLYASPDNTGIDSFEALKEYGADNRILFGSGGAGTSLYIVQKSMLDAMGLQSDTITQNGTAEGLVNLMAGTVDVAMSSFKDAADYVKSGEIVPIAWFGEGTYSDDDTYADGVPSVQDMGVDINYQGFYYYSIRKGTDQAIVDKLHDAFAAVYANPDFIAECEAIGFTPTGMSSDEISTYLDEFSTMASTTFTLE